MSTEIPAGDGVTSNERELTLDDILAEHFGGEEFKADKHKGMQHASKVIESLPEDGKKLIQNLRSDYSKKTTELAKQKRDLELREQAILSQNLDSLKSKMNIPDDLDIYSQDGLQKYVEAKVAKALHEQQTPLKERYEEDRRKDDLLAFKAQHPDMDELKNDIIQTMAKGEAADIKAAYWICKGKKAETDHTEALRIQRMAKAEQRAAAMKVGVGSNVSVKSQKPTSARDAYEAIKNKR